MLGLAIRLSKQLPSKVLTSIFSIVRAVCDHIRVEERRGHATEVTIVNDSQCIPHPESNHSLPY